MPHLKSSPLLHLHPYTHYEIADQPALELLASAEPEELIPTSYSSSVLMSNSSTTTFRRSGTETPRSNFLRCGKRKSDWLVSMTIDRLRWMSFQKTSEFENLSSVMEQIRNRESTFLRRPDWDFDVEGGDISDEDESEDGSEYEATEPDEMEQDERPCIHYQRQF
ncbi:hypothetical protein Ptr86124_008688 [Pyrenophora tritici-repentis]|uniref:Uncharacterized protein n=1 Tax=Pyrenophora tritici-repentis TaxID=45151 RepID=A0A922NCE3_9PLEO|nr:hypothetical protein Ptr86124_008688 [Pyrenophora tritici-repentis]